MNETRSILIVDDNAPNRDATEALFKVEGYTVFTASNPEQAMEVLRSDEDLTLALFDIKLGTAAKGLKLLRNARSQRPMLRIIAYTGADPELGSQALQAGATFFIQKSSPEDLVRIAESVAEMWHLERKLETHRLKSEEMQRIFDAVGMELLVRDSDRRIILVNQTKRKAWQNRHPDSTRHNYIGELVGPDDEESSPPRGHASPLDPGEYLKTREQKTAGYTLHIETRPLHADDGRVIGIIEAAIDISRRQRVVAYEHEIETMFATASQQEVARKIAEKVQEFTAGRARLFLMSGGVLVGCCCAGMEPHIQIAGLALDSHDVQAEKAFTELYPSIIQLDGTLPDPNASLLKIHPATETLFIPLMKGQNRLGMIVVDNKPNPNRRFTKEDLDLLALFRPCIEAALTNANLRDQERRDEMWLRAISEIDQALLPATHFEGIQEKVMKQVGEMLAADTTVLLIGQDPHSLNEVVRSPHGVPAQKASEILTVPNGPVDWVFRHRMPLKVERNLWDDPRFAALQASPSAYLPPNADDRQAALLYPLEIRGSIWAVAVFAFSHPISLSAHEEAFLCVMLKRISMAKARINDYCEMERVAMERAKESTVGLLASAYNHNFRNSMQGLLNKTRLLERKVGAEHLAAVSEIVGDVLAVSKRIESLRSWVMLDGSQSTEIELIGALREITELVADAAGPAGINLQMKFPEPPVLVDGGGGALKIAILDIFQNAVKFMHNGGAIRATLVVEDYTAALNIRDEGPGLPPEVLAAINSPKALSPGSSGPPPFGIGLYLAMKAVARVKGTIRASNPEGGGAQFEIRMPIINQGQQP